MPTSVITGVTGQDGAYLTQQLLSARAHSLRRISPDELGQFLAVWRSSASTTIPILSYRIRFLDRYGACLRLLDSSEPDYVYNLAAQSFVGVSFQQPIATAQMTGVGPLHLLEAIRQRERQDQVLSGLEFRTFTAAYVPFRRMRTRPFIRAAHMLWPSYSVTGLR